MKPVITLEAASAGYFNFSLKASGRVEGTVESGEVCGRPPDGRVGERA